MVMIAQIQMKAFNRNDEHLGSSKASWEYVDSVDCYLFVNFFTALLHHTSSFIISRLKKRKLSKALCFIHH